MTVLRAQAPTAGTVTAVAADRPGLRPAIALAVVAGLAILLAFPPYGLWWAAPVGVAALAIATHGRRVRAGLGLGALAGVVYFTPLLAWTNLHTGRTPWLLLSALQALYIALLGAASAWSTPIALRWRWAWPPLVAVLWTAQEALRDRTPFGGFPWGRLAFSQDSSPLLRLAVLGGAPLVTFGVALCGGLLAAACLARGWPRRAAIAGAAAAVLLGAWLVPLAVADGPSVRVAVVQGNVPRLGLDFNAQRRAVLDNHVQATMRLGSQVAQGLLPRPDLVVWPENSSDIDPIRNTDAAAAINAAARAIGVPILVGAVLSDPTVGVENASLVWEADRGVTGRYAKRHPAPFAEYVPLRDLARAVSQEVDRVSDMVPGDDPGVLRVGPATVGDVICFEVAYDDIVRDTIDGGGQLIAVQTNNATFDEAEARQQLAMVRLRAVEHGRDALMASTVGISAFVDSRGDVHDETRFNQQAVILRELRLSSARTLATRLGAGPEYVIVAVALAALLLAAEVRRRGRRTWSANPRHDLTAQIEEDE